MVQYKSRGDSRASSKAEGRTIPGIRPSLYYTLMSKPKPRDSRKDGPRGTLIGLIPAFISRYRAGFIIIAAVLAAGLALIFILRDTSVVIAVPKTDVKAYAAVMRTLAARPGAPKVRIVEFDGNGSLVLDGKRPGIAVVSLAQWVGLAVERGDLKVLSAESFKQGLPAFPPCIAEAAGISAGERPSLLPLFFDPWLMAWHSDFIGGMKTAPPQAWGDLAKLAKSLKKKRVSVLALPGREGDADLAWLAAFASGKDLRAAAAAFKKFPLEGRDAIEEAFTDFAGLQKDGLAQTASFSFPWSDALGLLLDKKAAGMLLPLSRYRAIDPVRRAPLIVSRLPELPASREYAVIADLRVLVMPSRGAAGRGSEKVIAFLAEAETQRALSDALNLTPAALEAPVRDAAAFEAVQIARGAGLLIPHPALTLGTERAADFSAALEKALMSPRDVPSIVGELYQGR